MFKFFRKNHRFFNRPGKTRGQTLVELLITIGIAAILLPALLTGFVATRGGRAQQDQRLGGLGYFREAQEAIRIVQANDWANLTDGTFHPIVSGITWALAAGAETLNSVYTRQIVISDVYRDASGNIVTSGGTLDLSTKLVTISVTWGTPVPSSVAGSFYFTRFSNLFHTDTTRTDFNGGTLSGTVVATTAGSLLANDGQVELAAGGGGGRGASWCDPNLSITPLDLPGQGITTAISATTTATLDFSYMTSGGNASGNSMDAVSITQGYPPVSTNYASYNNYKTYGIYVDNPNQYVYVTSDHPGLTVDIVEVSNKPYTQTGTFSASGGGNGSSIYEAFNAGYGHDVGYVTAGNAFYTFDLTSRIGARTELGHVNLAGAGKKIIVIGNYAYVAVSSSTEQLDIINISNPASPSIVSKINLGNSQPGVDISVNSAGSRTYIVTKQAATPTNDFFVVNTSSKIATLPAPIGSLNTGVMSPNGVAAVSGNKVIVVGSGGEQYKVIDLSTESSPARCGGLTNPNGATAINAIATVFHADNTAFSYVLTNTASQEFQIIEGGLGNVFSTTGTFLSKTFDAATPSAFNRFVANISSPTQTTIKLQVAGAAPVNNSCATSTFNYVGPDLTSNTYFTPVAASISGSIPFQASGSYLNPARCFRYKTFFDTTDITQSPVLFDMTYSYSP